MLRHFWNFYRPWAFHPIHRARKVLGPSPDEVLRAKLALARQCPSIVNIRELMKEEVSVS